MILQGNSIKPTKTRSSQYHINYSRDGKLSSDLYEMNITLTLIPGKDCKTKQNKNYKPFSLMTSNRKILNKMPANKI